MKRTFLLLVCTVCALLPTSAQKVISAKVAGVVYEALSDSTAKVTGWEHKSTNLSLLFYIIIFFHCVSFFFFF